MRGVFSLFRFPHPAPLAKKTVETLSAVLPQSAANFVIVEPIAVSTIPHTPIAHMYAVPSQIRQLGVPLLILHRESNFKFLFLEFSTSGLPLVDDSWHPSLDRSGEDSSFLMAKGLDSRNSFVFAPFVSVG